MSRVLVDEYLLGLLILRVQLCLVWFPFLLVMTKLNFFVFINGLHEPSFHVDIENSKTVSDLKEVIMRKNSNQLRGVDENQLTLYKVALAENDTLEQEAALSTQEQNLLKYTTFPLCEIFLEQLEPRMVSVVVRLPDGFTRREP